MKRLALSPVARGRVYEFGVHALGFWLFSSEYSKLKVEFRTFLLALSVITVNCFAADTLNGEFERGDKILNDWTLSGGAGDWTAVGRVGRCVSVIGDGKTESMSYWRATGVLFEPNKTYRVTFWAKRAPDATGGAVIAGPNFCNRDFEIGTDWEHHSFVFRAPSDTKGAFLRFGQWEIKGTVWFDDIELNIAQPFYTLKGDIKLGEGEMIRNGRYIANPRLGGDGANDWRPLAQHTAGFNTNRWTFGGGQTLVYHHKIGNLTQKSATIHLNVGYHVSGSCTVEADADGNYHTILGKLSGVGEQEFALPEKFFPAKEIHIYFRGDAACNLQIHGYRYEANLKESVKDSFGKTRYTVRGEPLPEVASFFDDTSYGTRLNARGADDLGLWQCDAARKVSRERELPVERATSKAIQIEAAKNEIESAQLVVRPAKTIEKLMATASELRGPKGAKIPAGNIEICEVAYVFVEHPTDGTGAVGWWPDPLPPLKVLIRCEAGQNQPLWISVRVPADASAGDYEGAITIDADGKKVAVPLKLHVWDFALPQETHLRSGFGFDPGLVKRYHNLTTQAELEEVCEKYYRNFAEHRIAPYNPMSSAPIKIKKTGTKENPDVELDFEAFDKSARHYLDEMGFNAFTVHVEGMPWGSFHESGKGKFLGYGQGTPEYERLMAKHLGTLQAHLDEKGWLTKAYVYWFDEPDAKDYPFVVEGMKLLKRFAPKLKRMLTEEPNDTLGGHVDLWCPVLHQYDPRSALARQKLGEEVWWYVCTVPKAPHLTEFIDHDAIEMRAWLWATWAYGIDGILVWQTNYWHSPTAFPNSLQNPWDDPMCYVQGYDTAAGTKSHWGNGDGRFTYPPNRTPAKEKNMGGPVNSIRWEMLREGIEDYEYFWLLREAIVTGSARASRAASDAPSNAIEIPSSQVTRNKARERQPLNNVQKLNPKDIAAAEKLLIVPPEIFRDTKHFARDPQLLFAHRRKIAEAIEKLK